MIKVSVIVPFYNAAWCIKDQLLALLKQDFIEPWELILVNNNSSDNSLAVIEEYLPYFKIPVKIVLATEKQGAAYAYNTGVSHSKSPYLAFCDADDRVNTSWLTHLYAARKEGALVSGSCKDWNGQPDESKTPLWNSASTPHLCGPPVSLSGNMLLCRIDWDKNGGFNDAFLTAEDCEFSWRFLAAGGSIVPSNNAYIEYRQRPTLRKTMKQYIQYGMDDIKLIKEYHGKLPYNYSKPMAPKLSPPIGFLIKYIRKLGSKQRPKSHKLVKLFSKWFGHFVGAFYHNFFLRK